MASMLCVLTLQYNYNVLTFQRGKISFIEPLNGSAFNRFCHLQLLNWKKRKVYRIFEDINCQLWVAKSGWNTCVCPAWVPWFTGM